MPGTAQPNDQFGAAVALGDPDGDGQAELAVGAPGDDSLDREATPGYGWGSVTVLPGSAAGVRADGAQYWSQRSSGVPGVVEDADRFGATVSFRELGGGSRTTSWSASPARTTVAVRSMCSMAALQGTDSVVVSQATVGVPGTSESGDRFSVLGPAQTCVEFGC